MEPAMPFRLYRKRDGPWVLLASYSMEAVALDDLEDSRRKEPGALFKVVNVDEN